MSRTPTKFLAASVIGLVALAAAAHGQGGDPASLRLDGLNPTGGANAVTESWGTLGFSLENRSLTDRTGRLLVFYPEQPDVQYGRDVWLPAGARRASWLPIGPAPAQSSTASREVKFLLADRTGGDSQVLRAAEDERLRNRAVRYRRLEPTTALLLDSDDADAADGRPGPDDSPAQQAETFARTFRLARGLSESLTVVRDRFLPPATETFDAIDQVVLAGNQLAADPLGQAALRHWVQQGGTLWVMLDRVGPETVAPLLGDGFGFQVVGRTSLTTVRLRRPGDESAEARELDRPVDLVRVALAGNETIHYEVEGWPAAFSQPLARGRVVFTTLAGPAWHRPRRPPGGSSPQGGREARSPFANFPDVPVPLPPLERLAAVIYPESQPGGRPDGLAPLLTGEIGYSVVDRTTAAVILGGFAVTLAGLGVGLRRFGRAEAAGWLGPLAAAGAAGLFVALGSAARQAVPPTAGAAAVVDIAPGAGEASAVGQFAVYRPDSGPTLLSGERGGLFELDPGGLAGQTRRRFQTDLGGWHWEGLSLPAGVRLGTFRTTIRTGPVSAVARFGPGGADGRLDAGRFAGPTDGVIVAPAAEQTAVRFEGADRFSAGLGDTLPAGQYLTGAVLTDRQQRRQEAYRQLLTRPMPKHLEGRDLLLAWATTDGLPFTFGEETRTVGECLMVIPLSFEQPAAGSRVTVPRAFVPCWSIVQDRPRPVVTEGIRSSEQRLRFDLPASVRPLTVERATLHIRVRAPGRRVSVTGIADGKPVPIQQVDGPVEPLRIEVADPALLRPDAAGGLVFGLAFSEQAGDRGPAGGDLWRIESVGLDVVGRVGADR
ncbi:MAG: hypothetical protein U0871_02965 [Gemmataceae bacterium]